MNNLPPDPINDAIYGKRGIKASVEAAFDGGYYPAGLILIFAFIDAMANIARPANQEESNSADFRRWVTKYIRLSGKVAVTPDDLWGARNAIIHTYGQESRDVRSGKAKRIAWVIGEGIRASWDLGLDEFPDAIAVDANALKAAFSAGVNEFLRDIYTGEYDVSLAEERLGELLLHFTDPELLRKV